MERCTTCDKHPLSKNEIGICKKLISEDTARFYCLGCLADHLDVTTQDLLDKIEEFKDEGCELFQ